MKSEQAKRLIDKINQAIVDIDTFSNTTELQKSYLAKFLVVFICGIYEEVIENIISERIDNYAHAEVSQYIKGSLKFFRNPSMDNIKGLLGKFDVSWKLKIEKLPQDAQTAIENIVDNKNSLAHGNDVALTLDDVKRYYVNSLIVIDKIDEILL